MEDQIRDILDKVLAAKGNWVRTECVAASCGTHRDWETAHKASKAFHDTYDDALKQLQSLIGRKHDN